MHIEKFLEFHKQVCDSARELTKKKGADYSCETDTLRNLKSVEALGIVKAEKGVLVRLADKFSRLSNLVDKPPEVKDESIQDTAIDIINYVILLLAIRNERKKDESHH